MGRMVPSRRQLEFLALHSSGMTFAEIGVEVHMSKDMVKYELDRLKRALEAANLYQAQVRALAAGYVQLDGRAGRLFVPDEEDSLVSTSA